MKEIIKKLNAIKYKPKNTILVYFQVFLANILFAFCFINFVSMSSIIGTIFTIIILALFNTIIIYASIKLFFTFAQSLKENAKIIMPFILIIYSFEIILIAITSLLLMNLNTYLFLFVLSFLIVFIVIFNINLMYDALKEYSNNEKQTFLMIRNYNLILLAIIVFIIAII